MRGRVYAVNSMVTITSNQLGVFRAGTAAALFGTIPSVLIGGFSTIAVVLISTKIFRELYDADRYDAVRATDDGLAAWRAPRCWHHSGDRFIVGAARRTPHARARPPD